jgi:hypothetical protein
VVEEPHLRQFGVVFEELGVSEIDWVVLLDFRTLEHTVRKDLHIIDRECLVSTVKLAPLRAALKLVFVLIS